MISFVRGKVAYTEPDQVVVEVQGIGYQIRTSQTTLNQVSSGQEVLFYTYLHVREDAIALFGFLTKDELRTFQILLGVSGIGPKAALAILSTFTVKDLYYAVLSDDVKAICKAPGIGPKGAKKMILELKDKLHLEDLIDTDSASSEAEILPAMDHSDGMADTMEALVALGYSNGEAYRAIHAVSGADTMNSEQLLKEALKKLVTL